MHFGRKCSEIKPPSQRVAKHPGPGNSPSSTSSVVVILNFNLHPHLHPHPPLSLYLHLKWQTSTNPPAPPSATTISTVPTASPSLRPLLLQAPTPQSQVPHPPCYRNPVSQTNTKPTQPVSSPRSSKLTKMLHQSNALSSSGACPPARGRRSATAMASTPPSRPPSCYPSFDLVYLRFANLLVQMGL